MTMFRKDAITAHSLHQLKKHRIEYQVRNGGYHLVCKGNGLTVDFWPTTEKFVIRGQETHYKGVHQLIKLLRKKR